MLSHPKGGSSNHVPTWGGGGEASQTLHSIPDIVGISFNFNPLVRCTNAPFNEIPSAMPIAWRKDTDPCPSPSPTSYEDCRMQHLLRLRCTPKAVGRISQRGRVLSP
ncbi:hypothetical protein ACOSQ4_006453 [Xanthoceras sorbifolium]